MRGVGRTRGTFRIGALGIGGGWTPNDPEKWVFPSSPPPAPRAGEWTGRQGALCSFFCSFCSCCLRLLAFLKVFLPGFQFSLFFFVAMPLVVKVI